MSKRNTLLTTAAAAALVGAMTSGAMAFDSVEWNWTSTVSTDFAISIGVTIAPLNSVELAELGAGVAEVQVEQVSVVTPAAFGTVTNVVGADVKNNALAAGNSQTTEVSDLLSIHSGQFAVGNYTGTFDVAGLAAAVGAAENSYPYLALATANGIGANIIDPATIAATATFGLAGAGNHVIATEEASNSAAAMGNNASWTVGGKRILDDTDAVINEVGGILVGDLTQFAYANTTATAVMTNVWGNLADVAIPTPTISNTATSVGNNLNIKVGIEPPAP